MYESCGCGVPGDIIIARPGTKAPVNPGTIKIEPLYKHPHDHHPHSHDQVHGHTINVEEGILTRNNLTAQRNRGWLEAKSILTLNLISSPGSGKTSLLEKTITDMKGEIPVFIIEGDQQTMNDANRIDAVGAPVVQINTGNGCHPDADMVFRAFKELEPSEKSVLMIENVGNLVCPSLFDLGESKRVAIICVTEGEDKPIKHPTMFESSDICCLILLISSP